MKIFIFLEANSVVHALFFLLSSDLMRTKDRITCSRTTFLVLCAVLMFWGVEVEESRDIPEMEWA